MKKFSFLDERNENIASVCMSVSLTVCNVILVSVFESYQTETLFNGQIDNVKMVKYPSMWLIYREVKLSIVYGKHISFY